MSEYSYIEGSRTAWREMLSTCLRNLLPCELAPDIALARMVAEREAAVAVLRRVCAEHGDNNWDPDLHLADTIEKHLVRHLDMKP